MSDYSKHFINYKASIREALTVLNSLSDEVLTLFVVDDERVMLGTLTDGDIRRSLIVNSSLEDCVSVAMKRDFHCIKGEQLDVRTIRELRNSGITLLPSLDENHRIKNVYNLRHHKSILPVDAVLMAGGKGERLRPLTEKTPKPLLPVGGKAIIDYNIESLVHYGISHIHVTVNYLKELIVEHFSEPKSGIRINCVQEPCFLGTIGSVQFVDSFHNDTVLLMNSDLFTNIDYEDFYLHFVENNADMSVAAVPYSVSVPYGIFSLDGRNILGIKEKPSYNYYANAGIYLIKKELLELVPKNQYFNATDFIDLLIDKNCRVIRFPLTGYWIDIGKREDYNKAQELVKHLV